MVKIGNSKFGIGIFAKQDFAINSIIFIFTGTIIAFKDTISLGENESYPIQIDKDKYLNPDEPWRFINHSCDPNCGLTPNLELIAIKNINEGDELYFDYSTSMLERSWNMNCFCDKINCRKLIQDFDMLPKNIQEYYLQLNIVQPFIKKILYDRPDENHTH